MVVKVVKPPKPKQVTCRECGCTLEYMPEDVQDHATSCMGETGHVWYVKCARPGCKDGRGIIRSE